MAYERELYAERLRLEAQAAAVAAGERSWSDKLNYTTRVKLTVAWSDAIENLEKSSRDHLVSYIEGVTLRSMGRALSPRDRNILSTANYPNEDLLSLIEIEHEALAVLAEQAEDPWNGQSLRTGTGTGFGTVPIIDPEKFRKRVNQVFVAHIVALHLNHNSLLVPIESCEMHDAVVAPTLYLLNDQIRFAAAEKAYQDALRKLRNSDPGDAITDAGTALQGVLTALGFSGNALGDQLKAAKKARAVRGDDTPLTDAVIQWVASQRNHGEAHRADHNFTMSDAWMVVHVVGALIIRLAEPDE